MAKADVEKELAKAQEEFEAERLKLEEKHKKKAEQLISKVRDEFAVALGAAVETFNAIPESYRQQIWSETNLIKLVASLGLKVREAKGVDKKSRHSRISNEEILSFIASEKGTQDVKEHFKLSALTAAKRLNALAEAGKATVRKEGTSKFWKKA